MAPRAKPKPADVRDPRDYPYDLPRLLHKPEMAPRLVSSIAECDEALADGWVIHPTWTVN